jgi:hypothetical protein
MMCIMFIAGLMVGVGLSIMVVSLGVLYRDEKAQIQ